MFMKSQNMKLQNSFTARNTGKTADHGYIVAACKTASYFDLLRLRSVQVAQYKPFGTAPLTFLLFPLTFFLFLFPSASLAQGAAFPVTAAVQSLPPFAPNFSNWADPINNKLGVILLLNDREEPGYQVRLRLTISGQGITVRSRDTWPARPIALNYGMPVQLTAADLQEYFRLENLDFIGYSQQAYLNNGGLPEGVYSLCVEAIDYNRSTEEAASAKACTFIQAQLLDPPVILAPTGNQTPVSPQSLLVQWQARHTATFMTTYRVEIYDMNPGSNFTPEQIYTFQQPVVETELTGITATLIDASFPQLESGRQYLLRVQARAPMGANVFKNAGYSEPVFFRYGLECFAPSGLSVNVQSYDRARVSWSLPLGASSYVVRYREKNPNANWYEQATTNNSTVIQNLLSGTTYEVQIQSECGGVPGAFGSVYEFTTQTRSADLSDCGLEVNDLPLPANQTNIGLLRFSDTIMVGRFSMRIMEVRASDSIPGAWDGIGHIYLEWLGRRINCVFKALRVNTDKVVYMGEVVAVDDGLASLSGFRTPEQINAARRDTVRQDFCGSPLPPLPPIDSSAYRVANLMPNYNNILAFGNGAAFNGASNLPVTVGSFPNAIAFYNIRFTPTGAFLDSYMSADIPLGNQHTAFQARNVGFHPGGLQGTARMNMMSDIKFAWNGKMEITFKKGAQTYVQFNCGGLQEVGLDMQVKLCRDIAVPVDPFTYQRDTNSYVTGGLAITANSWGEFAGVINISPFELAQLPGWAFNVQDAVFDLSESFTPSQVTFPSNYMHPDVSGTAGASNPAWRGFYLRSARVKIPSHFLGQDSTKNVTFGAVNMIIDHTGFTGAIYATNLLSIDTGRVASWALGIDSIAVGIQSNQFSHANLKAKLKVPALDDPLAVSCHIQPGSHYNFSIALTGTVKLSAFGATAELHQNTEIGISYQVQTDQFSAYAQLHGRITFSPQVGARDTTATAATGGAAATTGASPPPDTASSILIPYIAFQNFRVGSEAPYVSVGSWQLGTGNGGQPKATGFPLMINEIGMFQSLDGTEVAFGIDITLNLVGSDDQGFGARGRGFVICDIAFDPVTNLQVWSFNRVRLDKLSIDFTGPGYSLHGYILNYEKHPVYGSGFQGGIKATFMPGFSLAVAAMFGQKDDYRYFFVDALLGLDPGIPIGGPTGIALYGFGGGISYHMERRGFNALTLPISSAEESGPAPEIVVQPAVFPVGSLGAAYYGQQDPAASMPPLVGLPSGLGQSLSGVTYVPNKDVGIGIKAMVAFGVLKREVFNGDITFEIIFNANGGLRYIGLMGNANFITPPRTPANMNPQPAIGVFVDLGFDFVNTSFDCYMRLQVSVPPGIGLIRGAYANNVAGEGKIHASPSAWYIYLGEPTRPIALTLDLSKLANMAGPNGEKDALPPAGSVPLDSTSSKQPLGGLSYIGLMVTAYLCAGSILPDFPPPPPEVLAILGLGEYNITSRDHPSFANAAGLIFGSSIAISMPELTFFIFYASFQAGIGFDVMLRNYGVEARCANNMDSNDPIGINGWYATGQMYAYLQGAIGIAIDILGFKGRWEILAIGGAAILQARLPNPFWMRGVVGGYFSILGGLISGECQFEFEAGQECEILPGGKREILVIQGLDPTEDIEDASVFVRPRAIFNLPVDRITPVKDSLDNYVELKPVIQSFTVTNLGNNTVVPGTFEFDANHLVAAFRPTDILQGNQDFRIDITIEVLQRRAGQSDFEPVYMGANAPTIQSKSGTFRTGPAPDFVPEENVTFAYPVNKQTNFFRNESNQGYVQLAQGQDYLFAGSPGNGPDPTKWQQKIRFWQHGVATPVSVANYTYDTEANRIQFTIPGGQLQPSKVSRFDLVDVPISQEQDIDANLVAVQTDLMENLPDGVVPDDNLTQIMLETRQAEGQIEALQAKQLYRLDFRTSQYPTFAAKVNAWNQDFPFVQLQALTPTTNAQGQPIPYLSINDFGAVVSGPEGLDKYDLEGEFLGGKNIPRLVRSSANLAATASNWYANHIGPNVYDIFPKPGSPYFMELEWRNIDPFLEPPARATYVRQNQSTTSAPLRELTEYNITSGQYGVTSPPVQLRYHLPYVMYRDYADYKNQVWLYAISNELPADLAAFVDWNFIWPLYGQYELQMEYYLPGMSTPNSTAAYSLPYLLNNN
jgi:hypothetical protein